MLALFSWKQCRVTWAPQKGCWFSLMISASRSFEVDCGPMPKSRCTKARAQVWNRGGVAPDGWERFDAESQGSDFEAVVRRVNTMFPPRSHGPWHSHGSLGLRQRQVGGVVHRASELVGDLLSAWLLLLFCAATSELHTSDGAPGCLTLFCWLPRHLSEEASQ